MRFSAVLIFLFVAAAMSEDDEPNTTRERKPPKVIVLSMGAITPNLINDFHMHKTNRRYWKSATMSHFSPVTPTKGPVNHFSIATGLYADGHGVFDDCTYDEPKGVCEYGNHYADIMPVWIENEQRGGVSAVMNWPGSEEEYSGMKPRITIPYKKNINPPYLGCYNTNQVRIDKIFNTLLNDDANLVMVYYEEIDNFLHESKFLENLETQLDCADNFIDSITKNLYDDAYKYINLIVLGSHGANLVDEDEGIQLKVVLKDEPCPFLSMGANAIVSPKVDQMENVYKILKQYAQTGSNTKYNVYYQKDIPKMWHVKEMHLFENKIYLVATKGYFFWSPFLEYMYSTKRYGRFKTYVDGYDEKIISTFFMAIGPKFKRNTQVSGDFYTINVYPLLRKLLEWPEKKNTKISKALNELLKPIDDVEVEFEVKEKKKYDVAAAVNGKSYALCPFEKMSELVKSFFNSYKRADNTPSNKDLN